MSRRGRRGTDGEQDEGSWLPADYDDDQHGYPDARGRGSGRRERHSGPPWETGGWESDTGWQGRPRPAGGPGWQEHPSGPLPADSHPSGPLPPLPGGPGEDDYQPGGYHGESYPSGGYPAGPAGADPGSGAYSPPGEYQAGGFPAAGDYPPGSFQPPGEEYASGGYPAGDYPSGGYPAAQDYAGSGFGDPPYQHDYEDHGLQPPAPGHAGYPGRGSDGYPDEAGQRGYSGRGAGNDPGYSDRGGWYGDVDEQPLWTDEETDSGFLPGLGGSQDRDAGRRGGRPGGRPPAGRGGQRKRRGARRIMPRIFLAVLLLIVLGAGGYGYHLYRTYISPADYSGPGTGSVVVQIKSGDTATAVGQRLQQLGVVASARAFSNAAKASPRGNALEPGYYRVHKHMQAALALAVLLKPTSRVTFKVAIPEGLRLSQIIATLGKDTGNLAGYKAAIGKVSSLGLPPYANGNPEGYLFPATYTVEPGTPPLQVLQSMVKRFGQEAASVNLSAVARHDQLSEHDVIVVASLVQAEGGRVQDFPKIARVIYNRLNSGMKLQLDSTVMYALHTYGIMASNQQLQANSPYNTYLHANLPPGPIDSPGDAAIQAALHPATGNWVYFVTVDPKTGRTEFTSDPNVFAQLRAQLQQNVAHGK